jgi:hypothetical protein
MAAEFFQPWDHLLAESGTTFTFNLPGQSLPSRARGGVIATARSGRWITNKPDLKIRFVSFLRYNILMDMISLPKKSLETLLEDALGRDIVTARRTNLLKILLHERYLSREQLIVRIEGLLGKGCFGSGAWEDIFFRDMHIVKKALQAADYRLKYSRKASRPGYYLDQQPAVSAELAEILAHSVAEVDPAQIRIWRQMPPAERFRLGCSITDAARQAVAYRQPRLS